MKPSRSIILFLPALLLILYFAFGFMPRDRISSGTRLLMGTVVEIKVRSHDNAEEAMNKAFGEIARVEDVFSVFKPDSEISKINRLKPGERMRLSDEAFALIKKSVRYNKITGGAFDTTVKPLVDLWRRARETGRLPDEEEIRDSRAKVGSDKIILDDAEKTISFMTDGMALDLGGVAKGYATDRAIAVLKESGVKDAVVNSGGDMYCLGRRSAAGMWKVGVRHPRKTFEMILEMRLKDKAVDTSGDYEKYFISGGRRYSHIIDPRTGYPVGDDVVSATAVADDSATADIIATALCVLGGFDKMKDVDALIIVKKDEHLNIKTTAHFKEKYGVIEEKE